MKPYKQWMIPDLDYVRDVAEVYEEKELENLRAEGLHAALKCLSGREREIVWARFFYEDNRPTYRELGKRFGITAMNAQYIFIRAKLILINNLKRYERMTKASLYA